MAKDSGSVSIKNKMVFWDIEGDNITNFSIDKIKVIGEFTTSEGPFNDDWFFVFILSVDEIKQISAFAEGLHEALKYISKIKEAEIYGQLANSTEWKTRIIWPQSIKGQELYILKELPPQNIWEQIKDKIRAKKLIKIHLTEEVKKYLQGQ